MLEESPMEMIRKGLWKQRQSHHQELMKKMIVVRKLKEEAEEEAKGKEKAKGNKVSRLLNDS